MSRFFTLHVLGTLLLGALVLAAPALRAQTVPTTLAYQGVLTDGAGTPVPNGTYTVALRLFTAASGGSALYAENHTVTTTGGVFAAELGAGTPTTGTWTNVTFEPGYWLETAVGGTTLSPRTKLLAGPYARSFTPGARVTGSVGTLAGAVLRLENTAASGFNYGLLSIDASTGGRGIYGSASAASGETRGVWGQSASTGGSGVYGEASAATGTTYGVYGATSSTDGFGVYGRSFAATGTTYGLYGQVTSPQGRGVAGVALNTTGGAYGGHFTSASSGGTGVFGEASSATGTTYGGFFRSASPDGRAVFGQATATSGTAYGVQGTSAATTGRGVYGLASSATGTTSGVYGESGSTSGRGVYGLADAASGTTSGGFFASSSTTGRGVYGIATATSGANTGVHGVTASTGGRGVYGQAINPSGTAYGVVGEANSATGRGVLGSSSGSTGIGVQGVASATSGVNYAGYFETMSSSGRGVVGESEATTGTNYGGYFSASSASGYGLYATNFNGSGLAARFAAKTRFDNDMEFYEGTGTDLRILFDVNEGNNAPSIKLRRGGVTVLELDAEHNGNARVITEELEITGGSDLAEHFDVAPFDGLDALLPGMVVAIDPAQAGRLTVSATPYDPLVAGVVSGAGDVRPGFLMGQRGSIADGAHPIALVGRVYVLVDASYGAVRPGDLLTTSATPGHAMRAADRERSAGAVLGKAMSGLERGRGLVLVLVGLQ